MSFLYVCQNTTLYLLQNVQKNNKKENISEGTDVGLLGKTKKKMSIIFDPPYVQDLWVGLSKGGGV